MHASKTKERIGGSSHGRGHHLLSQDPNEPARRSESNEGHFFDIFQVYRAIFHIGVISWADSRILQLEKFRNWFAFVVWVVSGQGFWIVAGQFRIVPGQFRIASGHGAVCWH